MRPSVNEYLSSKGICTIAPGYDVMFSLLVIIILVFSTKTAIRQGYQGGSFFLMTCLVILCSFLAARLYGALTNLDNYLGLASRKVITLRGETGSFGAYFGGTTAVLIATRVLKLDTIKVLDLYSPFAALSIFMGRLGCFMSGCCYGTITSVPWAVSYPRFSAPFLGQQFDGFVSPYQNHSVPVHPVQLYESSFGAVLFLLLMLLRRNHYKKGLPILTFFISYSSFRFIMEFFRGDNKHFIGFLSLSQLLFLLGLVTTLLMANYVRKSTISTKN